jgi:asparagine synthetase B (glutamine-hydrolysing)
MIHRSTIMQLMRPHNTEMDLSIAMALYFAARGQGHASTSLSRPETCERYTTTARVLLSGLGADELFGGYSRHAAAFTRGGFPCLIDELTLDFSRIGNRNLGRDDRVISHWGKEARYPYLDEDFVQFALGLHAWEKCGFRQGKLILKHYEDVAKPEEEAGLDPSKMLLRIFLWRMGMRSAAAERKRAIQFGARTAKMELASGKRKGTAVLEAD